jgi:hypothetical protein
MMLQFFNENSMQAAEKLKFSTTLEKINSKLKTAWKLLLRLVVYL